MKSGTASDAMRTLSWCQGQTALVPLDPAIDDHRVDRMAVQGV
jgi:hypothetical protein